MMKFITFVIGCLSLFISGIGQAEVVQLNKLYLGGSEIELPGSGVTFTVPSGWRGKFNQTTRNFDMGIGNQNLQLVVRYRGSSYASVLADFQQGLPLVNGDSLKPNGMHETMQGKFHGEVFGYAGVINFMQLNAVGLVIKKPSGRAVEIKSLGIDQPFPRLSGHIGLITKTLRFPAYEQEFSAKANQQTSRSTHPSSQTNGRHQIQGRTVAGVRLAGKVNEKTKAPPAWVKLSKGDPFKAHGNTKLPKFVDHKGPGLYWNKFWIDSYKWSHWSFMAGTYLENVNRTKRLSFCGSDLEERYMGIFTVSARKSTQEDWKQVDIGSYQIYQTDNSGVTSDYKGALDTMFLDRKKGGNDVVLVEGIRFFADPDADGRQFWSSKYAFNGEVYSASGINESCSGGVDADALQLSNCLKTGGKECYAKVFPDTYNKDGSEKSESSRSSNSSSGSYDTHFGTTDSGAIIFSSPSGSICSGC